MKQSKDDKNKDIQNYNAIDLAKFICSILVVMVHVPPLGYTNKVGIIDFANNYIQNCFARIAVPFFFVCAGFFLYKKTPLDSFSFEPTKKYALRLFKLYIIWTIIYLPATCIEYIIIKTSIRDSISMFIKKFIFAGGFIHLWYLNATIFAVVLISFLLYKKISPKIMVFIAFILYVIGLFDQSWYGFITPLREISPSLWSLLEQAKNIILTTRDGLFEGFLFVGIGMLFANYRFNISKKVSLIGFIVSIFLLFIETYTLQYFGIPRARECDMFLCLIPVTFFGFSWVYQLRLPDKPIYKKLRMLSSLVYFLHLGIKGIIENLLMMIYEPLAGTSLVFIFTVVITIILSIVIMKRSDSQKSVWLKKLYT